MTFVEWAGIAGLALLAWIAKRFVSSLDGLHEKADSNSERLSRIEGRVDNINGKLANGFTAEFAKIHSLERDLKKLSHDVRDINEMLKEHAMHEEQRIIGIWQRLQKEGT